MSSLRRDHANLLCIVPILADVLFLGSVGHGPSPLRATWQHCSTTEASWCSGSTSDSKSDNGGSIPSEVTFIRVATGWPSGLRRQTQVLVSSEARVRTPLLSTQFGQGGANTPAWIRTRVARFKVWSANHYTTGAAARLAQSVARGSHNPKVVSSILAPRTFIRKQWRLSSVG